MSLTTQIEKIKKDFSDQIKVNENLSKYSWFNLGGPASLVFKPKDQNQLSNLSPLMVLNKIILVFEVI